MRERSRSTLNTMDTTQLNTSQTERQAWAAAPWGPPVTHTTNLSGSQQTTLQTESMVDHVAERFYRRRRLGEIINHPMKQAKLNYKCDRVAMNTHAFKEHREPNYFSYQRTYQSSGTYPWDKVVLHHDVPPVANVDIENLKRLSATKAFAKVNETSAQLWVTLAEAEKSIASIKSILYKVNTLVRHAKNRYVALANLLYYAKRPKEILRLAGEISDLWLQLRYGLRPLVYDAKNILDGIKSKDKPRRMTIVAHEGDTATATRVSLADWAAGYCYATTELTSNHMISVEVKTYLLVEFTLDLGGYEFGLASIMGTAWELIPLSFVLDWFWNVSNLLASWEPVQRGRVINSGQVVRVNSVTAEQIALVPSRHLSSLGMVCSASGGGKRITTNQSVERIVELEKPILPAIKLRLNKAKLLDLAALTRSLLKGVVVGKGLR